MSIFNCNIKDVSLRTAAQAIFLAHHLPNGVSQTLPDVHTHARAHASALRWPSAHRGGAAEAVTKVLTDWKGRRWEFVDVWSCWDRRRHGDDTQRDIERIHRPHGRIQAYLQRRLWKMKIFSRFHYVWYLVRRVCVCVCVFLLLYPCVYL